MRTVNPQVAKEELIKGATTRAVRTAPAGTVIGERLRLVRQAVENLCANEPLLVGVGIGEITYARFEATTSGSLHGAGVNIFLTLTGLGPKEVKLKVPIFYRGGKTAIRENRRKMGGRPPVNFAHPR